MQYNYETNRIVVDKTEIFLSNIENEIFNYLYENKGKLCSCRDISMHIYGTSDRENSIRILVYRIRLKLDNKIIIRSVPKKGYVID